jgi:hypothetical protein
MCVLKQEVKKIVNDFACSLREGEEEVADYIELYESFIKLAEEHAKNIQYECEQKIDAMTGEL